MNRSEDPLRTHEKKPEETTFARNHESLIGAPRAWIKTGPSARSPC